MKVVPVFTSLIFLFLFVYIVVCQQSNALAPFYVKTRSIKCYGNPDLLVNVTCSLKPINWEKTLGIMDSDLVGTISNCTIHIQLFKFTNQFRPFLWNITFNLCKILETGHGNPYGKVIVKFFSRYTSINHSCPYRGHQWAYGFAVDSTSIPFVIPPATYKLVLTFYEGWPLVRFGYVEFILNIVERLNSTRFKPTLLLKGT